MDPGIRWVLGAAAVIWVVGAIATLLDLGRHDVRYLPKLVWAAIIVLVSFPTGVILYFVLGRTAGPPQVSSRTQTDRRGGDALSVLSTPLPETPAAGQQDQSAVISTGGLVKRFGETTALAGVDLVVPKGASYGLIGPNGAGKTTLLYILTGLRRPSSGEVRLTVPPRGVGFLVDTPQFEPWLTAYEVVNLARRLTAPGSSSYAVDEALEQVGLAAHAHRRTGGFSRGMLQRLGLAACLAGDPELLILDEPAAALDPIGRREVLDLIGRLAQTKTVLLSTHILADVQQVCDTVGVIDKGNLRYQGTLDDLLTHTHSAYFLHVRPPDAGLLDVLRGVPWVTELSAHGPGRLRLVVSDAARAEYEIPRLVAEHGGALALFQPATDLETAFLELIT